MAPGHHSSDDVQFLYEKRGSLPCQVCGTDLFKLDERQRAEHYDRHFSDEPKPSSSKHKLKPFESAPTLKRKRKPASNEDVFWHPGRSEPPPQSFTPGLVPLLKKALLKSHAKGVTEKAYLCSEVAVHVCTESWDRGWGCGYRNFLMSCAALMGQDMQPLYFPLLNSPMPPGVRNLQRWIESAWAHGYDEEGAQQLKHKLIGTEKWIGTAELYVAFTSRGIPAALVDFDLSKKGVDALVQWIVEYFTEDAPKNANINDALRAASPVISTHKMPIVLQHSGHSRTVIGYERFQGKTALLMFDPARSIREEMRQAARNKPSSNAAGSSHKHNISPSKILNRVLHPRSAAANSSSSDGKQAKRLRAGNEDGVIVIDSDSDEPSTSRKNKPPSTAEGIDLTKVVKAFRVGTSNLARKDKYQILYFPMTAPLTEEERMQRQVVTSKKIS